MGFPRNDHYKAIVYDTTKEVKRLSKTRAVQKGVNLCDVDPLYYKTRKLMFGTQCLIRERRKRWGT